MASLFFSYSHKDEGLRNELDVHLSVLKRQGLITTWHDRRITAGTELGPAIDDNLNSASVILLLVSPDFINSNYCYEKEMSQAMERHKRGEAKVIPVILRPCDWQDLPFGGLMATPTDGIPVTRWPNLDEAFLNVLQSVRVALADIGLQPTAPRFTSNQPHSPIEAVRHILNSPRSSNLPVKNRFTDWDRDGFLHDGFEFIATYFENSMKELVLRSSALDQSFRRIDANRFGAAIYQNGRKVCRGAAWIGEPFLEASIAYSTDDNPQHGSMNEWVYVKNDGQSLYFQAAGMQASDGLDKQKLTAQGAAEVFWGLFIARLQ